MNIIQPYAKILWHDPDNPLTRTTEPLGRRGNIGIKLLQDVEYIGRVSHRSEDRVTEDSWKPFITAVVLGHGDWSITEHVSITVEAVVDRGITHEWVRHRLGAYTQESTRFVNYEKKMPPSFIKPFTGVDPLNDEENDGWWVHAIRQAESSYKGLLKNGCPPQIARSVFPNSLASKLIVTYNLRSWRHFFLMRTSKESHPQMREVTIPLLTEFKSVIPLLYDDIQPNMRQIDNMRLPR